jgi:cell wall assembly regulator SMI1
MLVQIERSEAPISATELDQLEQKLSIRLPKEFKDFILKHNGGKPKPSVFHFKHVAGSYSDSCVDWFLAIYDGEYDNFESYFETYKIDQTRIPAELVPIAHDPGGNLVCIAVDGPQVGAVYFWDHENEEESASYNNVHIIADSFVEFLNSLSES